jgi:hypothetical protein
MDLRMRVAKHPNLKWKIRRSFFSSILIYHVSIEPARIIKSRIRSKEALYRKLKALQKETGIDQSLEVSAAGVPCN